MPETIGFTELESKNEISPKIFDRDVEEIGGYRYTTDRLSCRLSNKHISDTIASFSQFEGKRVIDIGCGDGSYTQEFLALGASFVLGVDPAQQAIERARGKYQFGDSLQFQTLSIYDLHKIDTPFDVAIVRGVIHHLENPKLGIQQTCSVANKVIVIEPNGYSPALKIIEMVSPYHREHKEQSYSTFQIVKWFSEFGAKLQNQTYIGLVPFFCPDLLAKLLKAIEPTVEKLPLLKQMACAQSVMCFDSKISNS